MKINISDSLDSDCPLGCNDMWLCKMVQTLQRNHQPPSLRVGVFSETSVHLFKTAQLQCLIQEDSHLQAPKNTDSASP